MDLRQLLEMLVVGGIGGTLAYFVLSKWPWFNGLAAEYKRVVAFAANALIAVLAYSAAMVMGYRPTPIDWRAWVETYANVVIALGAVSFAASQVWHGTRDLSRIPPA